MTTSRALIREALLCAVALALLVMLLWGDAGCCRAPVVPPTPVAVPVGCLTKPPPERRHFVTTREGCPVALCFAKVDGDALLDELEERRRFDDEVSARCGNR